MAREKAQKKQTNTNTTERHNVRIFGLTLSFSSSYSGFQMTVEKPKPVTRPKRGKNQACIVQLVLLLLPIG